MLVITRLGKPSQEPNGFKPIPAYKGKDTETRRGWWFWDFWDLDDLGAPLFEIVKGCRWKISISIYIYIVANLVIIIYIMIS